MITKYKRFVVPDSYKYFIHDPNSKRLYLIRKSKTGRKMFYEVNEDSTISMKKQPSWYKKMPIIKNVDVDKMIHKEMKVKKLSAITTEQYKKIIKEHEKLLKKVKKKKVVKRPIKKKKVKKKKRELTIEEEVEIESIAKIKKDLPKVFLAGPDVKIDVREPVSEKLFLKIFFDIDRYDYLFDLPRGDLIDSIPQSMEDLETYMKASKIYIKKVGKKMATRINANIKIAGALHWALDNTIDELRLEEED